MKNLGFLKTYNSIEIKDSHVSVGFECLDRALFNPEKCYDLLAKTGVKYARCQTGWARCEKEKGVYDFEWLDSVVNNLISRGLIPWFNIGYGNPIYMPNLPAGNPTGVGCVPIYYGEEVLIAWCNYIESLTKHFCDRITHFEIWNEPDIPAFWYPKEPNGEEYAKFVKLTSKIIKSHMPNARIGISVSTPYCFSFIEDTLSNLTKESFDFFSYHAYSTVPEYRYPQVVAYLRSRLDANGFTQAELWQGEAGYPSWTYPGHWLVKNGCADERTQAVWQLRRYFLDIYHGVKRSSFFQVADMWETSYEKANEVIQKPAAHGILNGKVYTPKKSYETITSLSVVFSGNIVPTREYIHVDIPNGSIEELLSAQTFSFIKCGYPLYAYYLPLGLGEEHNVNYTANLCVTQKIEHPVLIDPYTMEIFELDSPDASSGVFKHFGLPLKDYPLIVTDERAFEITEDQ